MRELPAYHNVMTDEDYMSDEEVQLAPRRKKSLKSSMHRTGATTVVTKVTWPDEVVYTLAGKPASYQDILLP